MNLTRLPATTLSHALEATFVQAAFAQEGSLTAGVTTESLAGAEGEGAAQNEESAKAIEEVAASL
jgi:hypothetical protein